MRSVTLVLPCCVSGKGPGNERQQDAGRKVWSEMAQNKKIELNEMRRKPVMSIPTMSQGASTLMGRTVLARFLFLSVC